MILAYIGIKEAVALVSDLRENRKGMTNLLKSDNVLMENDEDEENEKERGKDDENKDLPHKRKRFVYEYDDMLYINDQKGGTGELGDGETEREKENIGLSKDIATENFSVDTVQTNLGSGLSQTRFE